MAAAETTAPTSEASSVEGPLLLANRRLTSLLVNFDDNLTPMDLRTVHVIDGLLSVVLRLVLNRRKPERPSRTAGGYLQVDNVAELVKIVVEHLLIDTKVQITDVDAGAITLRLGLLWPIVVLLLWLLAVATTIVSIIRLLILRVVISGAPVEVPRGLLARLRLPLLLDLVHLVVLLTQLQLCNLVELHLDLLTTQLGAVEVIDRGLGALWRRLGVVNVRLDRSIVEGGSDELDLGNCAVLLEELLQLSVHVSRVLQPFHGHDVLHEEFLTVVEGNFFAGFGLRLLLGSRKAKYVEDQVLDDHLTNLVVVAGVE